VIIAWGHGVTCASVHAVAAAIPEDGVVELSLGARVDTYWAMVSSASLEQLGITAGPLLTASVDPATCSSPSATFSELSSNGWSPTDSSPIARCVCFPKPTATAPTCPSFRGQEIELPETSNSNFGLKLSLTTVLAAGGTNIYLIDAATSTPTVNAIPAPSGLSLSAALAMDDGSIWIAGGRGALSRIRIGPPIVVLTATTSSPAEDFLWMDGSRASSAATDLYLLSAEGGWIHFDGRRWNVLHRFTPPIDRGQEYRGATLRLGASSALAVKGSDPGVVRLSPDGSVRTELVGARGVEPFAALASVPGVGTVVGSSTGTIYRDRGDGHWSLVGVLTAANYGVRSFTPYDDGFAIAGDMGIFAQYRPSTGVCPPAQVAQEQLNWIVPLGEDLITGGDVAIAGAQLTLEVLRRKP
jgi:hypothetical protein